ncbi:MAG TPA: histidine phosphatase family protein [Candidatus Dormibacteraeota bacterium]|nr:histidine phosphatase family protein [Candidatus Dormibacteraeota bacterium]
MGRIYLVREADAGGRSAWPGPDRLRPLTTGGWRQARELADRLDGAEIDRIVASPWLRCQQSVVPLAEAHDLPIETEPALGQIASVDRALRLVTGTADLTVFATHADLVLALIERLRGEGSRVRPLCGLAWTTELPPPAVAAV